MRYDWDSDFCAEGLQGLIQRHGRIPYSEYSGVVVCFGHASITVTLERHSHWIPSVERHSADGMDEALGKSLLLTYC